MSEGFRSVVLKVSSRNVRGKRFLNLDISYSEINPASLVVPGGERRKLVTLVQLIKETKNSVNLGVYYRTSGDFGDGEKYYFHSDPGLALIISSESSGKRTFMVGPSQRGGNIRSPIIKSQWHDREITFPLDGSPLTIVFWANNKNKNLKIFYPPSGPEFFTPYPNFRTLNSIWNSIPRGWEKNKVAPNSEAFYLYHGTRFMEKCRQKYFTPILGSYSDENVLPATSPLLVKFVGVKIFGPAFLITPEDFVPPSVVYLGRNWDSQPGQRFVAFELDFSASPYDVVKVNGEPVDKTYPFFVLLPLPSDLMVSPGIVLFHEDVASWAVLTSHGIKRGAKVLFSASSMRFEPNSVSSRIHLIGKGIRIPVRVVDLGEMKIHFNEEKLRGTQLKLDTPEGQTFRYFLASIDDFIYNLLRSYYWKMFHGNLANDLELRKKVLSLARGEDIRVNVFGIPGNFSYFALKEFNKRKQIEGPFVPLSPLGRSGYLPPYIIDWWRWRTAEGTVYFFGDFPVNFFLPWLRSKGEVFVGQKEVLDEVVEATKKEIIMWVGSTLLLDVGLPLVKKYFWRGGKSIVKKALGLSDDALRKVLSGGKSGLGDDVDDFIRALGKAGKEGTDDVDDALRIVKRRLSKLEKWEKMASKKSVFSKFKIPKELEFLEEEVDDWLLKNRIQAPFYTLDDFGGELLEHPKALARLRVSVEIRGKKFSFDAIWVRLDLVDLDETLPGQWKVYSLILPEDEVYRALAYFKKIGDVEGAKEFVRALRYLPCDQKYQAILLKILGRPPAEAVSIPSVGIIRGFFSSGKCFVRLPDVFKINLKKIPTVMKVSY